MEEKELKKCRNCIYDVPKNIRRCPYCGILNPTLQTIDVVKMIFIILSVMGIYSLLYK